MALAYAIQPYPEADIDTSQVRAVHAIITLDSSYPLGGYVVSKTALGFSSKILDIASTGNAVTKYGGLLVDYDPHAGTMRVFTRPTGNTAGVYNEVTSTNSLAGMKVFVTVFGY